MSLTPRIRCAIALLSGVAVSLFPAAILAADYEPEVAEASNEPSLALEQVTHPEQLKATVVTAEPDVANVVAFTIADDGTLYVAETFRQSLGVEDNRGHMNWLEDDLAAQSVEDRIAYMKKFFPNDWKEKFATHHDRIRRLVDTDGDGKYDQSSVYVTGFNDIEDGTGAGLLSIDNELFYTCIPDLYKISDDDRDGAADKTESMSTGYGVRFAFRGHDMHGLVRGPDGKLYWSIGDRGFNVKTAEGETLHKPDTGAVFRCNLDGSDLELFAYGLRNPQELAFNDHGDLFTVDNNSDSGDQARLAHVMEGSDAGWRMYFQYNDDRGPWNRERMWDPYRMNEETTAKQPAYILPPVTNITDGPSGFCAYPGTGFEPDLDWDGRFFICDFRGTASKSGIRSFRIPRNGAHFDIADADQPFWQVLATDCEFGPDGRFYISDWVDGWNGVGKARLYSFEDERTKQDAARVEAQELLAASFVDQSAANLVALLDHADRRVRLKAQWELADRGDLDSLKSVIGRGSSIAMQHAIWGMGQLLTLGNREVAPWLGVTLNYADEEVRLQATRALGWMNTPSNPDTSAADYRDKLLLMQFPRGERDQAAAAITYGRLAAIDPLNEDTANIYLDAIEANNGEDPALRHALVYGLSLIGRRADVSSQHAVIARAAQGRGVEARLAAVLVLRRWNSPLLAAFLNDTDARVVTEAARAIHEQTDNPGVKALAELTSNADMPDALVRRIIDANYKLRSPQGVERLLTIAADTSLEGDKADWRSMALDAVNKWADPPNLDLVDGRFRPLDARPTQSVRPMLADWLPGLFVDAAVRETAIEVAGTYQVSELQNLVEQYASSTSESLSTRVKALASLLQMHESEPNPALASLAEILIADQEGDVRSEARRVLTAVAPEIAVTYLDQAVGEGTLREKQAAVASLATMDLDAARTTLKFWLAKLQAGDVPPGLQLDLVEAAQATMDSELNEAANAYLDVLGKADSLTDQYALCLQGGNVRDGKTVFFGRAAASCRRCHLVNGEGADVGPDLTEIGKEKDRRYLLEAIVEPNKAIAKGFATKVLVLADGRIVSGIVRKETEDDITLVKPTGEQVVVPIDDIDAEAEGLSGMPADLYKSLSRREIRDLVAYLATLKKRKAGTKGEAHGHEE